ncbi:uncharacterized protein F5891DRAFT_1032363, partial [Suillus fuscotomentosus]
SSGVIWNPLSLASGPLKICLLLVKCLLHLKQGQWTRTRTHWQKSLTMAQIGWMLQLLFQSLGQRRKIRSCLRHPAVLIWCTSRVPHQQRRPQKPCLRPSL